MIDSFELRYDIVRLYRKYEILALGILVSDRILITAAHSIHDLPGPGCGGTRILIKPKPYHSTITYEIDYPIINSYDNPDLKKKVSILQSFW